MSIINSQPLIGASGQGGYFLSKSLRFRSSASAYLDRTPSSAGNRKTFTFSTWIKLGEIAASNGTIFSAGTTSGESTRFYLRYTGSQFQTGYGSQNLDTTVAVFRDPSAWYHLVLTVDTTQATAANRLKIYVNGVQQSVTTSVNFTQNVDTAVNNTVAHNICREAAISTGYVDGYLAEVNFIDGQALTPSSFGETSTSTGVWIPKKYTGTYGTNGFYLPFTDVATTSGSNAGLGKDFSGNGNYWTTNNISVTSGSTYDSMKDVPTLTDTDTANYAVLNPLVKFYGGTASSIVDGNLKFVSNTAGVTESAFATQAMRSGKWYAEVLISATATGQWIGVCTTTAFRESAYIGVRNPGYAYRVSSGNKCNNDNTGVAYAASSTTNDIIGIAMDADAGSITFYKNGVSLGVAFTSMTNDGNGWVFGGDSDPGGTLIFNFGQRPFAYTPPSGFKALNTFNLPTPTIGATASSQAGKYFNAVTYTGAGAGQTISGVGFQPDFVWMKCRDTAGTNNILQNAVVGATKGLESNTTAAEFTDSSTITAFTSDGFTAGGNLQTNQSSKTYVAWNWRASNTTAVTNTAGSITSTVSANTTAGFSIATFTCPSSGNFTVGHGLGVAPAMFILKTRSAVDGWYVYHQSLSTPASTYLTLNATSAAASSTSIWGNTNPTSTVLTLGTNAGIAANQTGVLYCFAQVAGYSAFGSYTGNGSSDGTFVHLGFRPKFVMIKQTNSTNPWIIQDSARATNNITGLTLYPNSSAAEESYTIGASAFDFLSNGFKNRDAGSAQNGSGSTYIYMAFAEHPFKYSLGK